MTTFRYVTMKNKPLQKLFSCALYFSFVVAGVGGVWMPPITHYDTVFKWVFPWFLVIGGLLALYGVVRDRWRWEFLGLPLIICGTAAYWISVVLLLAGTPSRLVQVMVVGGLLVSLHKRYFALWHLSNELKEGKDVTPDH